MNIVDGNSFFANTDKSEKLTVKSPNLHKQIRAYSSKEVMTIILFVDRIEDSEDILISSLAAWSTPLYMDGFASVSLFGGPRSPKPFRT